MLCRRFVRDPSWTLPARRPPPGTARGACNARRWSRRAARTSRSRVSPPRVSRVRASPRGPPGGSASHPRHPALSSPWRPPRARLPRHLPTTSTPSARTSAADRSSPSSACPTRNSPTRASRRASLASRLRAQLHLSPDGPLDDAAASRVYHYYLPVHLWCVARLDAHRARVADAALTRSHPRPRSSWASARPRVRQDNRRRATPAPPLIRRSRRGVHLHRRCLPHGRGTGCSRGGESGERTAPLSRQRGVARRRVGSRRIRRWRRERRGGGERGGETRRRIRRRGGSSVR